MKGATLFIKYQKVNGGYKAVGFSTVFKTVEKLKTYFNKTSAFQVKFIKDY